MQEPELKVGDWVSSEDAGGKVYMGWVDDLPIHFPSFLTMCCIRSGITVAVAREATVRLPDYATYEQLQQLADLALELKDREWFLQITEEMQLYSGLIEKESEIRAKR
ncbi:hypothetical protein D3C81_459920 [compost metagenome]